MDLSENMLQTAREHLAPKFPGQVFFVAADLHDIPLDGVLDGIFSTAAFHWLPDHDRLFRSLVRALKPGGWLEAQCGGGPNLARVRERATALMASAEYSSFFAGWAPTWQYPDDVTTAKRMRSAGFVEIKTWLEEAPATLSDAPEYKEFLATVTLHRHLARIPDPAMRDRFMDELARQAAADSPPFTLDYWRLNLSGRKPKNDTEDTMTRSPDLPINRFPNPLQIFLAPCLDGQHDALRQLVGVQLADGVAHARKRCRGGLDDQQVLGRALHRALPAIDGLDRPHDVDARGQAALHQRLRDLRASSADPAVLRTIRLSVIYNRWLSATCWNFI